MPCKSNQSCCNGDCNQGRTCPYNTSIDFKNIWHNFLYSTNFTLLEQIILLGVAVLITYSVLK
jgi:hypothetical protein